MCCTGIGRYDTFDSDVISVGFISENRQWALTVGLFQLVVNQTTSLKLWPEILDLLAKQLNVRQ
jgi:hypothetical protein